MLYSSDPFEQAFFDYINGDSQSKITVHNNKGDDEIMQVQYFFRRWEEMPEIEKEALSQCSGKVLDVGAGSGSHVLYLQDKGFDVTGLDIKPGFVEVMKKRGVIKTELNDIRTFKGKDFDTILMLMNGVGFTQNLAGLNSFLQVSRKLLKTNGQLILDSSDLLYLYQEDDGSYKIDLNESYYGEVVYQVEYKGIKGKPFKWLFVDFSNLEYYAEQAGFNTELLFEDENHNYLARLY